MPPFDRYVRVRPPFMGLGPGGLVPVTWSRLFAAAGKPFDENTGVSELPAIRDWVPDILRAGHRPSRRDLAAQAEWFEVAARLGVDAPTGLVGGGDCTLGAATFAALVEALAVPGMTLLGDPGDGGLIGSDSRLKAIRWQVGTTQEFLSGYQRLLEQHRADQSRPGEVPAEGVFRVPEWLWPEDRSWLVFTDFTYPEVIIGCADDSARRLLSDPRLEADEVRPDTHVG